LDAEVVQRADDLQRAEHAEHAVKLATGRLSIEMGAHIDGKGVRIRSRARGEYGAHRVDAYVEAGGVTPGFEEGSAFGIRIRQGLAIVTAGDAGADLRHIHQRIPEP